MPVYMSSLNQQGNIYLCVCAYPRVEFPCRLTRRPYLLIKRWHCRVERTTKEPASRVWRTHTHRHTGLLCIYVPPTMSMTTCTPASVLLLIYALAPLILQLFKNQKHSVFHGKLNIIFWNNLDKRYFILQKQLSLEIRILTYYCGIYFSLYLFKMCFMLIFFHY